MKAFFLLAIVAFSAVAGRVAPDASGFEPITFSYHRDVGIPKYEQLKKAEEERQAGRIVGGTPAYTGQLPYQVILDHHS